MTQSSRTDVATEPATQSASASGAEPFEQTLQRLEQVVKKLETPELPLEEALRAYEEGLRLVRSAHGTLNGMDARLEQLLQDGSTEPLAAPSNTGRDAR
jgi:exodeoxyribonuclease VII small subunit